MLIGSLNRCSCLNIIRRVQDNHSGNCAHQGHVLVTLMCCAVLPYRDTCMGSTDLNIQVRISDGVAHLLVSTACSEHGKCAGKRDFACGGHTCCNAHHIALRNTTVNMTLRKCFLECTGLCSTCQVSVQDYQVVIFFA